MPNSNTFKSFGWTHIIALIVLIAVSVGIALLRQKTVAATPQSSDSTHTPLPPTAIAKPDTTTTDMDIIVQEEVPLSLDTTSHLLGVVPDAEVNPDQRPADQAGYEDGFVAGSEDAAVQQYRASYDETNSFVGADNETYNRHYHEGYEAAYHKAGQAAVTE